MNPGEALPFNLQFEIDSYNKFNKSTWFLLPCFSNYNKEYNYQDFRFNKEFVDTYLKGIPEYDSKLKCPLYLRYKWVNTQDFKEFETFLINTQFNNAEYIGTEDFNGETIYIFNIKQENYYLQFLEGKYSEISSENKLRLLYFFNLSSEGIIARIFRKDQSLYQVRKMFLGCLKGNNCTCIIKHERDQAGNIISQNFTSCKYYAGFEMPERRTIELESPPDNDEETINFEI